MNFKKGRLLSERAHQLIPGGAHTYSKGDDQFPFEAPAFIVRGQGVDVWDADGHQFLDWGMGLRSVSLGHAYPDVLDAVYDQLKGGVNFTRPSPLEVTLAETLVSLIPCAEMVKFGKNGSDATTAAIRLARAYTGRDLVFRCSDQPFFSVHDWFIGNTAMHAGVPEAIRELTKSFPFNDAQALEYLLEQYRDRVACIILEPSSSEPPQEGFLQKVRALADRYGVVLIFDEIITGFRFHVRGAQHFYDVTPDLATFGKAIANGFSFSLLAGRRDLMEQGGIKNGGKRVFLLSATYGAETHALAAALKTIEILRDTSIIEENWEVGHQLKHFFNTLCERKGLASRIWMQGEPISPTLVFSNAQGGADFELRTLFLQEMIRKGVLMPYVSIAAGHRAEVLERTFEALEHAFEILSQALDQGSCEGLLIGPPVKPVFRTLN